MKFKQHQLPISQQSNQQDFKGEGGRAFLKEGSFESPNFRVAEKGWKINSDGEAEFLKIKTQGEYISKFSCLHDIAANDPVMFPNDTGTQSNAGFIQKAFANSAGITANYLGVASTNLKEGDLGQVSLPGSFIDRYSGLTPASTYYVQNTGGATADITLTDTATTNFTMDTTIESYQSFVAGSFNYLTEVQLLGSRGGVGDTITYTVNVYRGTGTNGTLVWRLTGITTWASTSNAFFVAFTDKSVPITPGNTYTIGILPTSISGTFVLRYDTGNPYSTGRNNVNATSDYIFKTSGVVHTTTIGTVAGSTSQIVGRALNATTLILK